MANQLKMADIAAILALARRGWSDRKIGRELGLHRETVGNYVRSACVRSKPATPEDNALTGSEAEQIPKPASAADNALTGFSGHFPPIEGVAEAATASKPATPGGNALTGFLTPPADPGGHLADGGSNDLANLSSADGASIDSPIGLTGPVSIGCVSTGAASTVHASADAVSGGASSGRRGQASKALGWREVIRQKLDQGLSAQRIFQDLRGADHGYTGSYHSVRRLVGKLLAVAEPPVRRMECAPAQEAQVDFGRGAPVVGADGKRRGTWVFRIVLSHSRKAYSEAVFRQSTDDFLRCLENAFAHFGGVPQTLVIDNLKAAVKRADWFDPELCPKARNFAEHYGIAILPTKPYTPRHKGKIENQVKYVKNNALKGMTFKSLVEQNQHLLEWESTVADLRIHGTTRQQVKKMFEEVEKPSLSPLPPDRFALFSESQRTVQRDGHVVIEGAHYSAPPEYLGDVVWARWDGRLVRLFNTRMEPIAVHAQKPAGAFSTQAAHLHPHKISGIEKGVTWMLGQTDRIGPQAHAWAELMLVHRGIEGVRVLMGLLSLSGKHPRQQVEEACRIAVGHGAYHLRSLRQLIQHQQTSQPLAEQQSFEFVQSHPIIRSLEDYARFVREAINPSAAISPSCSQAGHSLSQESLT